MVHSHLSGCPLGMQCTGHISALYDGHIEVFMDEFSVLGNSFDNFLENLRSVLVRCEETNLVLNWESATLWYRKA